MSRFLLGRRTLLALLFLTASIAPMRGAGANDGAEMRRIPAGTFLMGRDDGPADERPQHPIYLPEFFIDRLPVTNSQFARFLEARGVHGTAVERWYDSDDNDARIHRRAGKWQADLGFESTRSSRPRGSARWAIASGQLSDCRPKRNGRNRRAARTGEDFPGATTPRIAPGRISAPGGMTSVRWGACRKEQAPMACWISRATVGNG